MLGQTLNQLVKKLAGHMISFHLQAFAFQL